jgi:hypothetical protein
VGGVESKLGPLGTSPTEWPVVPTPADCDYGEFGGMKIGRGNRSTRRKPAPAPLYPPQIPLDQTRVWTQAARVGKPATNRLSYGAAFFSGVNGQRIISDITVFKIFAIWRGNWALIFCYSFKYAYLRRAWWINSSDKLSMDRCMNEWMAVIIKTQRIQRQSFS